MKSLKYLMLIPVLFLMNMALVSANEIYSLDITADIDNYGNAKITEVWDMYVDEGTEVYKPMGNLDNSILSNFRVIDESGTVFENIGSWNVSAGLEDKKYRNGINDVGDHIELCWGMGSYGSHIYTISYDVSNFVRVYDYDVVYWKFVNDSMDPAPNKININVNFLNQGLLEVKSFGFEGDYQSTLNNVHAYSNKGLSYNNYAVLLLKFEPGTFMTENNKAGTYEEVYKIAIKGAKDLERKALIDKIMVICTILFFGLFFIIFIFAAIVESDKSTYRFESGYSPLQLKKINYFRDIPTQDIFRAYFLATVYNVSNSLHETNVVGCLILKWIKDGQIRIIDGKKPSLDLSKTYIGTDKFEKEMYDMMQSASTNGILKVKDFTKWCIKHQTKYNNWFKEIVSNQEKIFTNESKITKIDKKILFIKYKKKSIAKAVDEEALQIAGLKKFLSDFSRIDTRGSIEVHLWEYYLIYAQMFGIADKVAKEFKKLYPELIEQSNFTYDDFIFINTFSTSVSRSISSSATSGSSSIGGGGGSFGGGSGGGCR